MWQGAASPVRGLYCLQRPAARGDNYCQNCGAASALLAEICVKRGVRLAKAKVVPRGGGKSKVVAMLLAVLLGFWTWLYTYKKDGWKFWVGLGAGLVNFFLTILTLGLPLGLGLWVWAIVDTATKSDEWYAYY